MSDRETDRLGQANSANADDLSAGRAMRDDASAAMADDTELSSEELDGVGGGALRAYKTDEDQGPDGRRAF